MTAPRHDSAHLHVSGRALYADDIPLPAEYPARRLRHQQHRARSHPRRWIWRRCMASAGVVAVVVAGDVPGENNYGQRAAR